MGHIAKETPRTSRNVAERTVTVGGDNMNSTLNSPVTQPHIYTFPIVGGTHLLYALDAEDADLAERDNWYACISPLGSFYAARTIITANGPRVELLHALVYDRMTGGNPLKHKNIVSVNGDLLNCSRSNITSIGARAYFKLRTSGASHKPSGVLWSRQEKKWRVQVVTDGKCKVIGYLAIKEDAQDAREVAVHGEY